MDEDRKTAPSGKPANRRFEDTDGVIYTPSSDRRSSYDPDGVIRAERPATPPAKKKLPVKKQKSQFAIFFITTVFVGAIIMVIAFAIVFRSVFNNNNSTANNQYPAPTPPIASDPFATTKPSESPKAGEAVSGKSINALITNVIEESKGLVLYDLDNNKTYSVFVDSSTDMKDKYGKNMIFAEYKAGEIVEAVFGDTPNILSLLKTSTLSWSFSDVSNVKTDTANKSISFANANYLFNDQTVCTYKGERYDFSILDPVDIVTLKGYRDHVYYIEIKKSHGTLVIQKRDEIANGILEINSSITVSLDENKEVKIPEGSNRLVIKANNIDPETREIDIAKGETYTLDLSDIKLKAGVITFKVSEPDAKLYINGEQKSYAEPIVLEYGEYTFKMSKDGFNDWEQKVKFESPSLNVTVTLEAIAPIVQVCKLTINTIPAGANIYIDNEYIGISPVTVNVEYGLRTILVKRDGYIETTFPVNINSSEYAPAITLQPTTTLPTPPPAATTPEPPFYTGATPTPEPTPTPVPEPPFYTGETPTPMPQIPTNP